MTAIQDPPVAVTPAPSPYRHTWKLKSNSRLLRYYLWLYEGSESNVNFCKLFWGVVLSPFVLFIMVVLTGAMVSIDWLGDHLPRRSYSSEDFDRRFEKRQARRTKGHPYAAAFVRFVSNMADHVAAFLQTTGRKFYSSWRRWLGRPLDCWSTSSANTSPAL